MTQPTAPFSISDSISRTLNIEIAGLQAMQQLVAADLAAPLERAVNAILNTNGRVIVAGLGKSGHVGRKIAATMASTGTPAYFVHPAEAGHGDLGMIVPGDVILALSWSGETAELAALLDYAHRFDVTLIAITSNAQSTLAKAATIPLILPKAQEACPNGLAPTTSTLLQMAMGDALAVALLEARGFTAKDFKVFHPGGRLGAFLKTARDLMHTGENLPIVPLTQPMSEALLYMTQKGFGCLIAVDAQGALAGVITDGDLRRHMSPQLLTLTVSDVMTANPRSIQPTTFVSDALAMMNNAKITSLIVVDSGKPVGLLHLHDLLRAGVK